MAEYTVEVEPHGPAAWIHYRESGVHLRFWWEFLADGASLSVPTAQEWDATCTRERASNALGRRQEILERIVQQVCRQVTTLVVEDRDEWIYVKY